MELTTRYFGKIEIDEKEIIHFPQGLPGFLEHKDYYLISINEESPFIIMQSIDDKDIAFITIPPWYVRNDYEFEINEQVKKLLKIESREDLLILVISTVKEELSDMTVNLTAPLVINYRSRLGKQVILDDGKYPVKYPVFPEKIEQEAR